MKYFIPNIGSLIGMLVGIIIVLIFNIKWEHYFGLSFWFCL